MSFHGTQHDSGWRSAGSSSSSLFWSQPERDLGDQGAWASSASASHAPRTNADLGMMEQTSSSHLEFTVSGRRCNTEDVMLEFRMNGFDAPYDPEEDRIWGGRSVSVSGGGGAAAATAYLRQKSWPEPERTPAHRLPPPLPLQPLPLQPFPYRHHAPPRPHSLHDPTWISEHTGFATSTPVFDIGYSAPFTTELGAEVAGVGAGPGVAAGPGMGVGPGMGTGPGMGAGADVSAGAAGGLSAEQGRVLSSLPDRVLYSLLRNLHAERRGNAPLECRFCLNNRERPAFCRSHTLRDGTGRLACPVLRAFVCSRCGASGDRAHTIKYCPLSTADDRMKSTAMLRSVRMASGRRRHSVVPSIPSADDYAVFGDSLPSQYLESIAINGYFEETPLEPQWAALEQKLLL